MPRFALASALAVAAASPAGVSQRVLDGFAGNGRRFRHSSGLLFGFRRGLFAVGFADLGKRRRIVAFRAGSACETARSCKWGSLALKVAHLDACFDSVGTGRHPRMDRRFKPAAVKAINRKLVWWRDECGRVYQMAVRGRARAKPGCCPYCSGRKRPERPIRLD